MADAAFRSIYGNIDSTSELGEYSFGSNDKFAAIVEGIHINLAANKFDRFRNGIYTQEELSSRSIGNYNNLREPVKELIVLIAAVTLSTLGDLQAYNSRMVLPKDESDATSDAANDFTLDLEDTPVAGG